MDFQQSKLLKRTQTSFAYLRWHIIRHVYHFTVLFIALLLRS